MNLTRDPWVPVVTADGDLVIFSLQELFASAHEIRDVSVKPHEKVSLLRLLICITQAALDGPKDFDAWETCREDIPLAVKSYLEKWQAAFELFGDGQRFLQVPGLKGAKEKDDGIPATKFDLTLASGNNATFFDNAAGSPRIVGAGRLALSLLAFQCFSPGGRIGVAKWGGVDTPGKGSSNHAPCTPSSMLHTFLQCGSLLGTIHLNLLNKEEGSDLGPKGWGKPVWEIPVNVANDKEAIANATGSYLGRLVPMSRLVRLDAEGRQMILANGLDYPLAPVFREPSATIVQRDKEMSVLGVSLGRSIWRQLSAITVKRRSNNDAISGPLALRNLDGNQSCTLWIGALSTDKAKIEDAVEAVYDLPAGMFRDAGRKLYEEGVALASLWQDAVSKSVKAYAGTMKLEPVPYDRARYHFWTIIEQHVQTLLRLATKPQEAGDLQVSEWGQRARETAHAAFEFACPRQTPRQIQAYAIGLQQLFLPKPKDPSAPAKNPAKPKKTS
jgi:CRISPR system Cascade subunit CasA